MAAERIENVYQKSQFVAQVFVEGDSLKVRTRSVFEGYNLKYLRKNGKMMIRLCQYNYIMSNCQKSLTCSCFRILSCMADVMSPDTRFLLFLYK